MIMDPCSAASFREYVIQRQEDQKSSKRESPTSVSSMYSYWPSTESGEESTEEEEKKDAKTSGSVRSKRGNAAVDEEASSDNGKHVHLRKRSKIAAIPAEISYGDALMTEHTCTSKQSEAHKSRNAGLRHRLLLNR
jgi:hypothetical protein